MSAPGRPDQAEVEDAVAATLRGWGAELDTFQKFWWMDWQRMTTDVIEAMRTGVPVLYEDDDPAEAFEIVADEAPVVELLGELNRTFRPRDAGAWLLARSRRLGGKRPIEILTAGDVESVRRALLTVPPPPPRQRRVRS